MVRLGESGLCGPEEALVKHFPSRATVAPTGPLLTPVVYPALCLVLWGQPIS